MSYHRLWVEALPYLNVRNNDEHTRYSFRFAEQLVEHCHARPEIALPAIVLHDVGWSTVPPDKLLGSFGPQIRYPELRRQHEVEGARIAAQILADLSYPAPIVAAVTTIIDGHDTRPEPLSVEDAVVKDADKLWLFTPLGLEIVAGWFSYSVAQYLLFLSGLVSARLYTEPGRQMAAGLLVALRAKHQPTPPGTHD